MVSFHLTDEQKMIQQLARDFAREVMRPAAAHYDEIEETPWEIMREARKLGLDSYSYPEEYGGRGMHDALTHAVEAYVSTRARRVIAVI